MSRAATEGYDKICERLKRKATREDVPALIAILKDPDPSRRRGAAHVLGKVGSPWATPEALAALKVALKDDDEEVRRAATEAWETSPPVLKVQVAAVLELPVGRNKAFQLQVYRHKVEGPVLVKFEGLPKGVLIPEVKLAADQDVAQLEASTVSGVAPGTEQEVQVRASAGGVKSESRLLIHIEHAPLTVEAYLRIGRFAEGEAAMVERLKESPKDDQARFGLGVLRFIRGVERLGQALHKYGARSENTDLPFLRLPVPKNLDPVPIDYRAFRRMLADFHRDLSAAEVTLAEVTDDKVKLPLRLALIRLDLVGDGRSSDKFIDILKKIMQLQQLNFLESNPDFLVCFDRGDVAWLRAYCHLLMGMLDFYLAFDTERSFVLSADELFVNPDKQFHGSAAERQQKLQDATKVVAVKEPARLSEFRKHLLKVAELNRETWKHIRAETDDDHEWLPNPRQKGVLGVPVNEEMINAWLAMMGEVEALLDGKRTLTFSFITNDTQFVRNGKGLNLKTLFDDPPEKFVREPEFPGTLPDKYFSERKDVDINALFRVFQIFGNTTTFAYAAWFN